MKTLFIFGFGYSAGFIAALLQKSGWTVSGTGRSEESLKQIEKGGAAAISFADRVGVVRALDGATHLLVSTPPVGGRDPALINYRSVIQSAKALEWVGYLSTIGVYGDHGGAWIDEDTAVAPDLDRGHARVAAENEWSALCAELGIALDIFRLAGIYGPGRSPLDRVAEGRAQRVIKPGQVFNRIHAEDIASIVAAAIAAPAETLGTRIFNVTDDEPAPPQDVIVYAASLLGMPLPPEVPFEVADLSPMARSFYEDNKRVRNGRIRDVLGVSLMYPTFREGLSALAAGRQGT